MTQKIYEGRHFTVSGKIINYELYSDNECYYVAKHTVGGRTLFIGRTYKTYRGAMNRLNAYESAVVADKLPERW